MGREIKRVAAGFEWPLGKVWEGFISNPHRAGRKCLACKGHGESTVAAKLGQQWYGYAPFRPEDRGSKPFLPADDVILEYARRKIQRDPGFYGTGEGAAFRESQRLCGLFNGCWSHHLNEADVAALVKAKRLTDLTHTWDRESGWQPKDPPYVPSTRDVNLWSCLTMGHDSINQWVVVKAECKRLGVSSTCSRCHGHGVIWSSRGAKERYENWEPVKPPAGDWWQVWETVSEGSPVTPAFATRAELVDHLVSHGDCSDQRYGRGGWKREDAESFVTAEWAPTLMLVGGKTYAARDGALPAFSNAEGHA